MYKLITKIAALIVYVVLSYLFFRFKAYAQYPIAANIVTGAVALFGLISFSKEMAIHGSARSPGVLPAWTIALIISPFCFLYLLPYELYELGLLQYPVHITVFDFVSSTICGALMAAYIWIPFILYMLIDFLFKKYQAPRTDLIVT